MHESFAARSFTHHSIIFIFFLHTRLDSTRLSIYFDFFDAKRRETEGRERVERLQPVTVTGRELKHQYGTKQHGEQRPPTNRVVIESNK